MKTKSLLATFAAGVLAVSSTVTAQAAPPDKCTRGSAQKVINAGIVAANQVREGRVNTGIVDAITNCRYVLYDDGETFTFSEDDVFAGMTAFTWWDWESDGYTRAEVKGIMKRVQDTVLLAEVMADGSLGEFVEVPIVRTPVKYHVMAGQGMTAYQITGVVLDLEPGTYVSQYSSSSPDFPDEDFTATVTLVVTPD